MTIVMRLKRGDNAPALRATITDDGNPVDLSLATVKVIGKRNGQAVFARTATSANNIGVITMNWLSADTSLPGLLSVEFELTWPDGTIQSIPPSGYLYVLVTPDLDGTP